MVLWGVNVRDSMRDPAQREIHERVREAAVELRRVAAQDNVHRCLANNCMHLWHPADANHVADSHDAVDSPDLAQMRSGLSTEDIRSPVYILRNDRSAQMAPSAYEVDWPDRVVLAGVDDVHDVAVVEVVTDIVIVEAVMPAAAGWKVAVGDTQVQRCESLVHTSPAPCMNVVCHDTVFLNLALVSHAALAAVVGTAMLDV
jgi:hypothetical protein